MKIVILYSGGLDSIIMNHYAEIKYPNAEIIKIYYKHGADSEDAEIEQLPSDVIIHNVDWLNDKIKPVSKKSDPFAGAIYIPGRNMVFSTLAACQYLPDEIWMGTLVDECNEDATDKNNIFIDKTSDALNYVLSPFLDRVKIRFPFVEEKWSKVDSVKWAVENGLSIDKLTKSVSCWHHDGVKSCGKCKQCYKRELIFLLTDIKDSPSYQSAVFSDYGKKMTTDYLNKTFVSKDANLDETNVSNMIVKLIQKGIMEPLE